MTQSITNAARIEEWLARLHDSEPAQHGAFAVTTDRMLNSRLAELANGLHESMSAWHNLGTTGQVSRLFGELDRYLSGLSGSNEGWLRRAIRSLTHFIIEPHAESGLPESTLPELELAYQNTITYRRRITALLGEHTRTLEDYSAWIGALAQLARGTDAVRAAPFNGIVARSADFISAQRQLALTVSLQQQNIQQMADDIHHISTMARSLSINKDAARQLQTGRYERELRMLQSYNGKGG